MRRQRANRRRITPTAIVSDGNERGAADTSALRVEDTDTARLVGRFQAGEREVFSELYLRYFDRVYAYLRTVLGAPEDSEEVTQTVFVKVLDALPRYQARRQPFRAWLFTIARNAALDHLRRQRRDELTEPAAIDVHREAGGYRAEDLSALDWITDADLLVLIDRLPLAQRQVLVLRYMLDLKVSEVAEVLGRTRTDVSTLQYRALEFLHERLSNLGRVPRKPGLTRMRRWGVPASVIRSRRFALR